MFAAFDDVCNTCTLFFREIAHFEQLRKAQNGIHGGAELVTHTREKLTLCHIGPHGLFARLQERFLSFFTLGDVNEYSKHASFLSDVNAVAGCKANHGAAVSGPEAHFELSHRHTCFQAFDDVFARVLVNENFHLSAGFAKQLFAAVSQKLDKCIVDVDIVTVIKAGNSHGSCIRLKSRTEFLFRQFYLRNVFAHTENGFLTIPETTSDVGFHRNEHVVFGK